MPEPVSSVFIDVLVAYSTQIEAANDTAALADAAFGAWVA